MLGADRGALRRGLLVLGLSLGAMTGAALASPFVSAVSLPPMPQPVESRCAPVSISAHLVNVGAKIEASAGPATPNCGGPASSVTWSWPDDNPDLNQIQGLVKTHACPTNSSHCEFKARLFTAAGEWLGICISGAAPQGAFTSCESYAVRQGAYHSVGGTIFNLPSRKPITVHLSGPGGSQTTTTDSAGFWHFVAKNGTYRFFFRVGHRTISRQVKVAGKPANAVTLNLTV